MIKLINILEEVESPFNGKIQVIKTFEGTRLLVGGISQSGWLVRSIWDRVLKKIVKTHPEISKVLILGLGGGSVAELVEKYWPESKVVGVDIDAKMVELGKKYLKLGKVGNIEVVIADAQKWIKNQKKKNFDLVIVDMYQGDSIPSEFKEEPFLRKLDGLLAPGGIACFNHLYSYSEKKDAHLLESKLRRIFPVIVSVTPEANIIFVCFKG